MSLFIRDLNRTMAHPDWVDDAYKSLCTTMRLRQQGVMPSVLETTMVVTPMCRMLRGIYGDDWTAVWALAGAAAENTWSCWRGALWRFWRYRICLKSPDQDWNEMMEEEVEETDADA